MNMLSRVDSDQKATAARVDSIDDTLRRVEREVSEIRGTLRAAETPSWIRFYVYPACVLISAAMVAAVIHLEIVANGIGKNVGGLQVSLARQNLTTYAALPPSEFKAALPDVSSSIAVARKHNITVPPKVIEDLSNQLKASEPATSGFWPAAAELISYRSALSHEDILHLAKSMPRCVDTQPHAATTAKAIQADPDHPQFVPLNPAHYDNCRIQLDSPEENEKLSKAAYNVIPNLPLVFNHCLVIYNGGVVRIQIPTHTLTFADCLWEFSVSGTPPPSGQKITETLLASNPDSFTFPVL